MEKATIADPMSVARNPATGTSNTRTSVTSSILNAAFLAFPECFMEPE